MLDGPSGSLQRTGATSVFISLGDGVCVSTQSLVIYGSVKVEVEARKLGTLGTLEKRRISNLSRRLSRRRR